VACRLADSLPMLIGFRVLQAVGAAMLQGHSVALITTSAPRHRMRAALGVQAAAEAVGLAIGPTVGRLVGGRCRLALGVGTTADRSGRIGGRYLLPRTRHRNPAASVDWLAWCCSRFSGALLLVVSTAFGACPARWSVCAAVITAVVGSVRVRVVGLRSAR